MERSFDNIINMAAGVNTALEAVNAIIGQLKVLQGVAYETGLALDTNVLQKQAALAAPAAAAAAAPASFVERMRRAVRDITQGGLPVSSLMAGYGATGGGMPPDIAAQLYPELGAAPGVAESKRVMTYPAVGRLQPRAAVTTAEEKPSFAFTQQDIEQIQQAKQFGEAAYGQYLQGQERFEEMVKTRNAGIREELKASKQFDPAQNTLLREAVTAREQAIRETTAIGKVAGMEAAPQLQEQFQKSGLSLQEYTKNLKLGEDAMSAYNKQAETHMMQQSKVAESSERGRHSFLGHARSIVEGMLVWQALNTVMKAGLKTYGLAVEETGRLDSASARMAVTLGVTKDQARALAQEMSVRGIQYGLAPAESLPIAQYAARVQKEPAARAELTATAGMLGAVTGEDPKKLIDDLNVAYRQTGISVSQLGDMAAKAFQNSGTSASEYLNILREIGPLAQESGIDIERMAAIAALAADRMGGSMSDAANTMTRLIKAVTDPNAAQLSILNRYQIPIGDVQQALDLISKANMSAQELATLGGRPGMPAVANDIRTLIAVYKEYDEELQRGKGLQDQFKDSVNNLEDAQKRLGAAWSVLLQSFGTGLGNLIGGAKGVDTLAYALVGLSEAIKKVDIRVLAMFLGAPAQTLPGLTAAGAAIMGVKPETPESKLPGGRAGERWYEGIGTPAFPTPTETKPTMTAMQMMQMQAAQAISAPMDVSKYTAAQIEAARTKAESMTDDWIKAQESFFDSLGIPPDKKDQAMQSVREMADSAVVFIQDITGNITTLTGAQALNFQDAIRQTEQFTGRLKIGGADWTKYSDEELKKAAGMVPQYQKMQVGAWEQQLQAQGVPAEKIGEIIASRMAEVMATILPVTRGMGMTTMTGPMAAFMPETLQIGSRTKALEDRLADLRSSLDDLNETETKRAQLEGMWNIPAGAKMLVPLTAESQQLIKEHGGETEDQARNKRRDQILREIAETEAKLAAEKAKDAQLLAILNSQQQASTTANIGLNQTGQAGQQAAAALYALKAAAGDWGGKAPGPTVTEQQQRERVAGAIPEPAPERQVPAGDRTQKMMEIYAELALKRTAVQQTVPTPQVTATGVYGPTTSIQSNVTLRAVPMNVTITSTSVLDGQEVARSLQRYFTRDLVYEATSSGTLTQ